MAGARTWDVAVVGAGPAGCAAALACAGRGQRVLLLERDPSAAASVAMGEWLHPPAMDALEALGVDLEPPIGYPSGKGFVVHPEDGTEPIALPYRAGRFGFSLDHGLLVETMRAHAAARDAVDYRAGARATRLEGDALTFETRAATHTVRADRVVLATGADVRLVPRAGVWTFASVDRPATHRIATVTLTGAVLPFEGYLHLFVGGPGVALAYRVGPSRVCLALDVPLSLGVPREGGPALLEAYAPALPAPLADALSVALSHGAPAWTSGRLRPRGDLTRGGVARVGDAAGSLHPITMAGATLALADARSVARARSLEAYRRSRRRGARVPETVAIGLSELFTDLSPETVAIRRATYRMWRDRPGERLRSMGFVSGERDGALRFGGSALRVMLGSAADVARGGLRDRRFGEAHRVGVDMLTRIGWMVGGSLGWTEILPDGLRERLEARGGAAARYGAALHAGPSGEVVGLPARRTTRVDEALRRGTEALLREQADDGSFEGEVVWCPMLAAQYVLALHVMDRPIGDARRRRLLRHFETTRLPGGAWGLHERSEPYLFVTTLVYVAARLLGARKDDPLLREAKAFIRREGGAVGIPSWGKLWLALVDLYDWEGVSPVVPELWAAPRWLPIHPSRYYCHTRLIYLGMATLYGERVTRPATPTVRAIRDEIFTGPYDEVDFAAARENLREGDVYEPPSAVLRWTYRALKVLERTRTAAGRAPLLAQLRDRIRYELRSTHHTCISPVSGLLDVLALWSADGADPDVARALEAFEGWIWEDDDEGTRVCGARSASWDTAFAAQALSAVAPFVDVADPLRRADAFLRSQQIAAGTGREAANDRLDPTGGYCFAGVWHGWPVSDCTAEAMLGRLESPVATPTAREMTEAARFVLRCQNTDGGFGSYEARRVDLPIDWLNPSEMFGACMTERSYVECTASCVAALAAFRARHPDRLRPEIDHAIDRAVTALRAAQRPDGSFEGMWGVHFIYGTMFGVRGLLAGGVPCVDPQIRRACAWLQERQRPDGGWGEHHAGVLSGRYVEHEDGQVVQTAWALTTLLEARAAELAPLERAARFLAERQGADGTWPKQDPEGIFFHTALLDYRLYRRYFPVWALGLYQRRVRERQAGLGPHAVADDPRPPSPGPLAC
ncbi:MAG TPA: FAD-dependent oxidoreductase [Sandaracinaceae bacterium LLY-WYZ-13_1]|nr:FAD-dependent oxidoreductase [Sandaracinaceae bacterium LLY-WYZ-13_1]